jgi:hypothetical protein
MRRPFHSKRVLTIVAVSFLGAACTLDFDPALLDAGTPPSAGLRGHWTLDEGLAIDTSDADHDGIVQGDPAVVSGKIDGALSFDGIDDHVEVGDPADGQLDFGADESFTYAAWVFAPELPPDDEWAVSKKSGSYGAGYWMEMRNTGHMRCRIADGTNFADTPISATPVGGREDWHHVACAVDRAQETMSIYIDGQHEFTTPIDHVGGQRTGDAYLIARMQGTFFKGLVDDVRLYGVSLNETDVRRLFDAAGQAP